MVLPMADARLDSPVFHLWTGQALNAGQTLDSGVVDARGWAVAALFVVCTQNVNRTLELSDDGVTWYALGGGGANATISAAIAANTPTAVFVTIAGARFLRVRVQNTGGSAGTLTARVGLGRS